MTNSFETPVNLSFTSCHSCFRAWDTDGFIKQIKTNTQTTEEDGRTDEHNDRNRKKGRETWHT